MATRIEQLARPKPNRLRFPDRRSVYWVDHFPPERSHTTSFDLSPRWSKLAESKPSHLGFEHSSRSPEWPVSVAATRARASRRVCSLALPRQPVEGWQPDRPIMYSLTRAVQSAVPSRRVCELSQPKRVSRSPSTDHWLNNLATAQHNTATSRIHQLSAAKVEHPDYLLDRPVSWPLSSAVTKAVASGRIEELSQPKVRKDLFEGYNPYIVTQAARSATASPRVEELSAPLPRKCRKK
ncbi:sperm microtubule associated protein 2 [Engraulis encrasicolus]|uniref:sperm microtubule associated protein 2 n=1 Tax=Engraulis encrasicolus TaxID=184585 RepID=UPI002FD227EE